MLAMISFNDQFTKNRLVIFVPGCQNSKSKLALF